MNWLSNTWNKVKGFASNVINAQANFYNNLVGGNKSQTDALNNTKITPGSSLLPSGVLPGGDTPSTSIMDEVNYWKNLANSNSSSSRITPSYNVPFSFDENAARNTATNEYNPYYANKAAELQKTADITSSRAAEDFNIASQLENDALNRYLEQSGLLKTRTKEDLMSELGKIATEKGLTQAQTSYERQRQIRDLVGELSSKGLQFGGMAAQAGADASKGRELVTNQLENAVAQQTSAANTTATRAGEDIALNEKARQAENVAKLKSYDLTKTRTLEDVNRQLELDKAALEEERKYKIENAVNQRWQQAYDQWDLGLKQFMAKYGVSV